MCEGFGSTQRLLTLHLAGYSFPPSQRQSGANRINLQSPPLCRNPNENLTFPSAPPRPLSIETSPPAVASVRSAIPHPEVGLQYNWQRRMEKGHTKLKIDIIHPDLGIGGAERVVVDAAVELTSYGHDVHVFTAHHDRTRCFEETISGPFPVTVYGSFLPRQFFYRFHAVCAYLRCIFVALCVLFLWPTFDIILADQVSDVVPLLKLKKPTKVICYCHFPDLLLAQHTTTLRRLYRKPIDMIEEATTGAADMILVNSRFTASTFASTFRNLHSRGIRPAVLYPAVSVEQFSGPCAYKLNFLSVNHFERKKNLQLAISAFALLHSESTLPSQNLSEATLTVAGGFDKRLKENIEYLEELKRLVETEGVLDRVNFVISCSTAERNALLSNCMCSVCSRE